MTNQEQLLQQAQAEVVRLKKRLADVDKLEQKIKEYDSKRREYEKVVEEQTEERKGLASSQLGLGQAMNFVPVISHAYNYGASKVNEKTEVGNKKFLTIISKEITIKYKEIQDLIDKIKDKNSPKPRNQGRL